MAPGAAVSAASLIDAGAEQVVSASKAIESAMIAERKGFSTLLFLPSTKNPPFYCLAPYRLVGSLFAEYLIFRHQGM